jgi:hypothetical protein
VAKTPVRPRVPTGLVLSYASLSVLPAAPGLGAMLALLAAALAEPAPRTGPAARVLPEYFTHLTQLTEEELQLRLDELRRQQRQRAVQERLTLTCLRPRLRADDEAELGRWALELGVDRPRLEVLARDPGIGWRADADSIEEARIALSLEREGRLVGVVRDPDPHGGDFIEDLGAGRVWDVKSFRGANFDLEACLRDVEEELAKGEDVIISQAHLSPGQTERLRLAVASRAWSERVIFSP